jgi:hypothetical protein
VAPTLAFADDEIGIVIHINIDGNRKTNARSAPGGAAFAFSPSSSHCYHRLSQQLMVIGTSIIARWHHPRPMPHGLCVPTVTIPLHAWAEAVAGACTTVDLDRRSGLAPPVSDRVLGRCGERHGCGGAVERVMQGVRVDSSDDMDGDPSRGCFPWGPAVLPGVSVRWRGI